MGSLFVWQWTTRCQTFLHVHHHVFALTQWYSNHRHKVVKRSFWHSLKYRVSVRNIITFVKWDRIFQMPSSLAHFCCYGDQSNVRRSWFHSKAAKLTDIWTFLSPQETQLKFDHGWPPLVPPTYLFCSLTITLQRGHQILNLINSSLNAWYTNSWMVFIKDTRVYFHFKHIILFRRGFFSNFAWIYIVWIVWFST